MEKIKEFFAKFYIPISIVIVILGIAAAWGIFFKPGKVEYKDRIEYKEDTKITSQLRQEISNLTYKNETIQKQLDKQTEIAKNINTIDTKIFDPVTGKLIKEILEKIDKTQINTNSQSSSTQTTFLTIIDHSLQLKVDTLEQYIKKLEAESKITTNVSTFGIDAGYNPPRQAIRLGPTFNFTPNTFIGFEPEYAIIDNKFSYWISGRLGF
jgi:hypothetical protein